MISMEKDNGVAACYRAADINANGGALLDAPYERLAFRGGRGAPRVGGVKTAAPQNVAAGMSSRRRSRHLRRLPGRRRNR